MRKGKGQARKRQPARAGTPERQRHPHPLYPEERGTYAGRGYAGYGEMASPVDYAREDARRYQRYVESPSVRL